jgi:hypothetical protein
MGIFAVDIGCNNKNLKLFITISSGIIYSRSVILLSIHSLSMKFFSKFYDDGAGNGGAGDGTAPVETAEVFTPELKQELESLRAFQKSITEKEPEKTPEQLQKEVELEKVNFRKYSVENDLMKDDDFQKFETVRAKKDEDLVFEDFSDEWEKDNPDADPRTKEADKRAAFEVQYHITSENKTNKERGQKLIAQEAKALRNPLETSYQTAKSSYDQEKMIKGEIPGYNQFIESVIKENTPEKLVVKTSVKSGKEGEADTEIDVDVELTEDQRKEIEKLFKNPKTFHAYVTDKDKRDDLKAKIAKKISGYIKENNFDRAVQRAVEVGHGNGMAKGSTVGAEQPFAIVREMKHPSDTLDKSQMKEINESFDAVRQQLGM